MSFNYIQPISDYFEQILTKTNFGDLDLSDKKLYPNFWGATQYASVFFYLYGYLGVNEEMVRAMPDVFEHNDSLKQWSSIEFDINLIQTYRAEMETMQDMGIDRSIAKKILHVYKGGAKGDPNLAAAEQALYTAGFPPVEFDINTVIEDSIDKPSKIHDLLRNALPRMTYATRSSMHTLVSGNKDAAQESRRVLLDKTVSVRLRKEELSNPSRSFNNKNFSTMSCTLVSSTSLESLVMLAKTIVNLDSRVVFLVPNNSVIPWSLVDAGPGFRNIHCYNPSLHVKDNKLLLYGVLKAMEKEVFQEVDSVANAAKKNLVSQGNMNKSELDLVYFDTLHEECEKRGFDVFWEFNTGPFRLEINGVEHFFFPMDLGERMNAQNANRVNDIYKSTIHCLALPQDPTPSLSNYIVVPYDLFNRRAFVIHREAIDDDDIIATIEENLFTYPTEKGNIYSFLKTLNVVLNSLNHARAFFSIGGDPIGNGSLVNFLFSRNASLKSKGGSYAASAFKFIYIWLFAICRKIFCFPIYSRMGAKACEELVTIGLDRDIDSLFDIGYDEDDEDDLGSLMTPRDYLTSEYMSGISRGVDPSIQKAIIARQTEGVRSTEEFFQAVGSLQDDSSVAETNDYDDENFVDEGLKIAPDTTINFDDLEEPDDYDDDFFDLGVTDYVGDWGD
jgi:hypothetical protein